MQGPESRNGYGDGNLGPTDPATPLPLDPRGATLPSPETARTPPLPRPRPRPVQVVLPLGLLWFVSACLDRLWLWLDNGMPAWDQADYLNGALNYWALFQGGMGWEVGDRFSPEWWQQFWQLAPKIPPLTYVLTAPFVALFGPTADGALLVQLLFSALLLGSVYGLARLVFASPVNHRVGLLAAAICMLLPSLAQLRLDYLLDYPVTASVCAAFALMTLWLTTRGWRSWLGAIAAGLALGLAILVKQTAVLFLLLPLAWVLSMALLRQRWGRLLQGLLLLLMAGLSLRAWVVTNWLLILTSSKRATVDSALLEGDPSLLSPAAWLYYLRQLPSYLTWPLLGAAVLGLLLFVLLHWGRQPRGRDRRMAPRPRPVTVGWLLIFVAGAYLFASLNPNKDPRYILPVLPVLTLLVARGLTLYPPRLRWMPPLALGITGLLLLGHLFLPLATLADGSQAEAQRTPSVPGDPRGQAWLQRLSPGAITPPRLGMSWPHSAIVQTLVQAEPHLENTLGVLPSTPSLNQHNLSFFGAQRGFRVFGRQVGVREDQVAEDLRSLNWFLTKTGDQGSIPPAQPILTQAVETSPDFRLQGQWADPDGGDLRLYRRRQPWLEVKPSPEAATELRLLAVELPQTAPPNQPLAVTYRWQGSLEQLQNTVVALTWEAIAPPDDGQPEPAPPGPTAAAGQIQPAPGLHGDGGEAFVTPVATQLPPGTVPVPPAPTAIAQATSQSRYWFHDHGPGLGFLRAAPGDSSLAPVQVTERLAMLPMALPGQYRLRATAIDRSSGVGRSLALPETRLTLRSNAPLRPAPPLDWNTQLRQWAQLMPEGPERFGPVFEEVARVNQYDPRQDYVAQSAIALDYRLAQSPELLSLHYSRVLAAVLQQDVAGAIAALEPLTQLDSDNAYVYAYLGFVHLYGLQPWAARAAIDQAKDLAPDSEVIQILDGVAGLMGGNLLRAIAVGRQLLAN